MQNFNHQSFFLYRNPTAYNASPSLYGSRLPSNVNSLNIHSNCIVPERLTFEQSEDLFSTLSGMVLLQHVPPSPHTGFIILPGERFPRIGPILVQPTPDRNWIITWQNSDGSRDLFLRRRPRVPDYISDPRLRAGLEEYYSGMEWDQSDMSRMLFDASGRLCGDVPRPKLNVANESTHELPNEVIDPSLLAASQETETSTTHAPWLDEDYAAPSMFEDYASISTGATNTPSLPSLTVGMSSRGTITPATTCTELSEESGSTQEDHSASMRGNKKAERKTPALAAAAGAARRVLAAKRKTAGRAAKQTVIGVLKRDTVTAHVAMGDDYEREVYFRRNKNERRAVGFVPSEEHKNNPWACPFCPYVQDTNKKQPERALSTHIKTHQDVVYPCVGVKVNGTFEGGCGKKFCRTDSLVRHLRASGHVSVKEGMSEAQWRVMFRDA